MDINLEGQRVVIVLTEFEARLTQKAWLLIHPLLELGFRVMLRLLLHFLSTDRKTFRSGMARVAAGEDPSAVFDFESIRQLLLNDPKLLESLPKEPTVEEIEQLLPEGEEDED